MTFRIYINSCKNIIVIGLNEHLIEWKLPPNLKLQ